ncbi:N-Acetylneuraminate cytidylyltransferase [Mucinivorans hirudinis]|uniref:N-Acetylneuraminate cytidylyltransferase n=1 Tax=Mucinivorans hirudinis TaxID=1433126 RepID=A0A060R687_9BACT|nr:N-Acetylneuraminate cytidylyltransferase [Mucinivorans hirudinis]
MPCKMKKIAFIPLRAQSKGIEGKNTKALRGKPLFCWILDTVISCSEFDEIWVATDCDCVRSILGNSYPNVSLFDRSSESATDLSPTIDVVMEFLSTKSYAGGDWFVLFQATSPFTRQEEIKKLCAVIGQTDKVSVVACYRSKRFRWSSEGVPLDYSWSNKPRRQDYEGVLLEAGAFYASKISSIEQSKQLITSPAEVVEISETTALDIDNLIDFAMAETFIEYGLL